MPLRPEEVMNVTAHRPYPLADAPWVMVQRWRRLLFAHWRIPVETMRRIVPSELTLDTFNGEAWIGIVPFAMYGVRARYTPPLPWVSSFLELNVRTYIVVDGQPGVYFFSLDAENPLAVAAARLGLHLPYFRARMGMIVDRHQVHYTSERTHRGASRAELDITYGASGPERITEPGTLEHWLVERYCLATVHRGETYVVEIHHVPWHVRPATATIRKNTMTSWLGVELPDEEPHLLVTRNQDVLTWLPRKL